MEKTGDSEKVQKNSTPIHQLDHTCSSFHPRKQNTLFSPAPGDLHHSPTEFQVPPTLARKEIAKQHG
jgi:hypothetical protein